MPEKIGCVVCLKWEEDCRCVVEARKSRESQRRFMMEDQNEYKRSRHHGAISVRKLKYV